MGVNGEKKIQGDSDFFCAAFFLSSLPRNSVCVDGDCLVTVTEIRRRWWQHSSDDVGEVEVEVEVVEEVESTTEHCTE